MRRPSDDTDIAATGGHEDVGALSLQTTGADTLFLAHLIGGAEDLHLAEGLAVEHDNGILAGNGHIHLIAIDDNVVGCVAEGRRYLARCIGLVVDIGQTALDAVGTIATINDERTFSDYDLCFVVVIVILTVYTAREKERAQGCQG